MLRYSLFGAIFIMATTALYSQRKAPGYMGKRFLLQYESGISWSLGGDARGLPNLFHSIHGDAVLTAKKTFGFEYTFMYRKYMKDLGNLPNTENGAKVSAMESYSLWPNTQANLITLKVGIETML